MMQKPAAMFDRIARRYDFMNRIISLGLDMRWRRALAGKLDSARPLRVLDVAAGTGDQMLILAGHAGVAHVTGIDISPEMIAIAQRKSAASGIDRKKTILAADSHRLPFADNSFDAVTVSFGIRNFTHPQNALGEMHRVLVPDGRLLILELTIPEYRLVRLAYHLYSRLIIPFLGTIIARDRAAYRYLHRSIQAFPSPSVFHSMLADAGFERITIIRMTLGVATIFEGTAGKG